MTWDAVENRSKGLKFLGNPGKNVLLLEFLVLFAVNDDAPLSRYIG